MAQVLFETTSALFIRLQKNVCHEPVKIRVSPNPGVLPAVVEQAALTVVSKDFFRDFNPENEFAWFEGVQQQDREYNWTSHAPEARKIFLYWLINKRMPNEGEINSLPLGADEDYQYLLAESFALAQEKSVSKMMNDVMHAVFLTLPRTELTVESIQRMLAKPALTAGTMLRLAICEEILYQEHSGNKILQHLDLRWALRLDEDFLKAYNRFTARGRTRGKPEDFFVDPTPAVARALPSRRLPTEMDNLRLDDDDLFRQGMPPSRSLPIGIDFSRLAHEIFRQDTPPVGRRVPKRRIDTRQPVDGGYQLYNRKRRDLNTGGLAEVRVDSPMYEDDSTSGTEDGGMDYDTRGNMDHLSLLNTPEPDMDNTTVAETQDVMTDIDSIAGTRDDDTVAASHTHQMVKRLPLPPDLCGCLQKRPPIYGQRPPHLEWPVKICSSCGMVQRPYRSRKLAWRNGAGLGWMYVNIRAPDSDLVLEYA
ncbi:hypothetical protein LTR62_000530 [Meristemomyces frigidus]|uniref:Uncharacterized protein n=1 Tax=Meristemomyces frigidus TaxID=1508187 RepID=A0AAN7T9C3_9PEZI|nr:hypothetical protein LTR62_000530 [Meristemomyces frigidus]